MTKYYSRPAIAMLMTLLLLVSSIMWHISLPVYADDSSEIWVRYNGNEIKYIDIDGDVEQSDVQYDSPPHIIKCNLLKLQGFNPCISQ